MSVELIFFGVFPNPYGKDTRKKLQDIQTQRWEPDSEDFLKAANQSKIAKPTALEKTPSVIAVLTAIALDDKGRTRNDHSISRLDLFTHSKPGWIALAGTVTPPKSREFSLAPQVSFNTKSDEVTAKDVDPKLSWLFEPLLDETVLKKMADSENGAPLIASKRTRKQFTFTEIVQKFADNATMVVYSCEPGLNKTKSGPSAFAGSIAKVLGLSVGMFDGKIKYEHSREKLLLSIVDSESYKPVTKQTEDYRTLDAMAGANFVLSLGPKQEK